MTDYTIDDVSMTPEGRVRARVSAGRDYRYCEVGPVRGLFMGAIAVPATQRRLVQEFVRVLAEQAIHVRAAEADDTALAGLRGVFRAGR